MKKRIVYICILILIGATMWTFYTETDTTRTLSSAENTICEAEGTECAILTEATQAKLHNHNHVANITKVKILKNHAPQISKIHPELKERILKTKKNPAFNIEFCHFSR